MIRKQLYETNGISWLPRDYFKDHTSTNQDIEDWNNVLHFLYHPFSKKKEFRRSKLIEEIKRTGLSLSTRYQSVVGTINLSSFKWFDLPI